MDFNSSLKCVTYCVCAIIKFPKKVSWKLCLSTVGSSLRFLEAVFDLSRINLQHCICRSIWILFLPMLLFSHLISMIISVTPPATIFFISSLLSQRFDSQITLIVFYLSMSFLVLIWYRLPYIIFALRERSFVIFRNLTL